MVTETIPEIAGLGREIPNISEPSGGYYARQEGKGLLLGAYESKCVHWAEAGTPLDFSHELLPDDLSRMEANLARAVEAMQPEAPVIAIGGLCARRPRRGYGRSL